MNPLKSYVPALVLGFVLAGASANAQAPEPKELNEAEITAALPKRMRYDLGIHDPIRKAYAYTDRLGEHLLVVTEHVYQPGKPDPLSDKAKAVLLRKEEAGWKSVYFVADAINRENDVSQDENSIWFWTKYMLPSDLDGDGDVDPLFVYGTQDHSNGVDDGRLRIVVYYKGKPVTIRHQNGTLDFQRHTDVDPAFVQLPKKIQDHVKSLMRKIESANQSIFPTGWEKKLGKGRTSIKG